MSDKSKEPSVDEQRTDDDNSHPKPYIGRRHSKDTLDIRTICTSNNPLKSCILIPKGDGTDERISVRKAKSVQFADALGKPLMSVKTLADSPDTFLPFHLLSLRSTTRRTFSVDRNVFLKKENQESIGEGEYMNFDNPCTDLEGVVTREKVCLKNITFQDGGRGICGNIVVKNLCFEKRVEVRYTWDEWTTQDCAITKYECLSEVKNADLFTFQISATDTTTSSSTSSSYFELIFAICYTAKGCSYWDSNAGKNYRVKLTNTMNIDDNKRSTEIHRKGFLLPSQCFGSAM